VTLNQNIREKCSFHPLNELEDPVKIQEFMKNMLQGNKK